MTKSPFQWVYFFFLVAVQLCASFGDVGVDVCSDGLDYTIPIGNPGIIDHDNDLNLKIYSKARRTLTVLL